MTRTEEACTICKWRPSATSGRVCASCMTNPYAHDYRSGAPGLVVTRDGGMTGGFLIIPIGIPHHFKTEEDAELHRQRLAFAIAGSLLGRSMSEPAWLEGLRAVSESIDLALASLEQDASVGAMEHCQDARSKLDDILSWMDVVHPRQPVGNDTNHPQDTTP